MEWIYENSEDNKYRYVLGTEGKNPLLCFGVNPSTAEAGILDNTMKSVDRIAKNSGYDSWIMLNLYPQRATNPNDMDLDMNERIFEENLKWIRKTISNGKFDIWAAWGTLIEKRGYLWDSLRAIVEIAEEHNCRWISFGKKTKYGHPHHPLFLRADEKYEEFNIYDYIK